MLARPAQLCPLVFLFLVLAQRRSPACARNSLVVTAVRFYFASKALKSIIKLSIFTFTCVFSILCVLAWFLSCRVFKCRLVVVVDARQRSSPVLRWPAVTSTDNVDIVAYLSVSQACTKSPKLGHGLTAYMVASAYGYSTCAHALSLSLCVLGCVAALVFVATSGRVSESHDDNSSGDDAIADTTPVHGQ